MKIHQLPVVRPSSCFFVVVTFYLLLLFVTCYCYSSKIYQRKKSTQEPNFDASCSRHIIHQVLDAVLCYLPSDVEQILHQIIQAASKLVKWFRDFQGGHLGNFTPPYAFRTKPGAYVCICNKQHTDIKQDIKQ